MDDPILIKAKEALSAATAAGDTAKASAIKQKTLEYLQRRKSAPAVSNSPEEPTKDTSFMGALKHGFDAPMDNVGDTLDLLGAHDAGKYLKDLVDTDPNYQPSKIVKEGDTHAWYDPRHYNYSELPRAAVEGAGQIAGDLVSRAVGTGAGGLVAGPAGALAGGLAGPAGFQALQVLGPVAKQRAKANGREAPNMEDWTAAAATAGVEGGLNALIPGRKLLRPIAEAVTGGAQDAVQQVGETAGTPGGLEVDPSRSVAAGLQGLSAQPLGAAVHGTATAPIKATVALAKKANDPHGFKAQAANDEASLASDARVAAEINEAKNTIRFKPDENPDVATATSLWKRYRDVFKEAVDVLHDSGQITRDDYDILVSNKASVLNLAGLHNARLDYIRDIEHINSIKGLDDNTKQALAEAAMDMDTLSRQGRVNRSVGPVETAARTFGPLARMSAGGAIGSHIGGVPGAVTGAAVGLAAGKALTGAGRAVDRFMGTGKPTILKGAAARQRVADKQGIDTTSSFGKLNKIIDDNYSNPADVVQLPKNYFVQRQKALFYKQKLEEAKQARAQATTESKVKAEKLEAEAQAVRDDALNWQNMTSGDRPPLGGWKVAIMHSAKDRFGLDIKLGDVAAALKEAVDQKHLSEDDAISSWYVPGARINKAANGGEPYYAVHDNAIYAAAKREGMDLSLDQIRAKRPEPTTSNPVRNPQAYQATIDHASEVRQEAVDAVPDNLRPILEAVRAASSKYVKSRLVEKALEDHPDQADFIKTYLEPLSKIGGKPHYGKGKALPKNP